MKYEIRDVCDCFIDIPVIMVYLYNEESGIGIELRLTDHSCSNFRRTYEHFFKWLQDMSNVEIDPDCIITAFEKFNNARKGAEEE